MAGGNSALRAGNAATAQDQGDRHHPNRHLEDSRSDRLLHRSSIRIRATASVANPEPPNRLDGPRVFAAHVRLRAAVPQIAVDDRGADAVFVAGAHTGLRKRFPQVHPVHRGTVVEVDSVLEIEMVVPGFARAAPCRRSAPGSGSRTPGSRRSRASPAPRRYGACCPSCRGSSGRRLRAVAADRAPLRSGCA